MKIAINCIYYTARSGGIAEYIYNLVVELIKLPQNNSYIFYVEKDYEQVFKEVVGNKGKVKVFPFSTNQKIKRALFQQKYWTKEAKIEKFDVFHSPFFHIPNFSGITRIITVHDLRLLNYPESYTKLRYIFLKFVVKKSILSVDHIIAISEFTKAEILKHYNIKQEKISVVHEAVNSDRFQSANDSKEEMINGHTLNNNTFLLAIGHLEPRKNYIRLINAYELLPKSIKDCYKLVIVGRKNHDYDEILDAVNKSSTTVYLDFVSREHLVWLYKNCKLHLLPSYYEGFGFSSLEAGFFSKPTIGANQSSIPEISGEGGVYFDPFDENEMSQKIKNVIDNVSHYDELSKKAKINSEKFSWTINAVSTLNIYEKTNKINGESLGL